MANSPFKMNGFSGFGNSPLKQKPGITDPKLNKKVIARAKEAKSNLLTPEDRQASKDTIRQSNIEYFTEHQYGPRGNISKHFIDKSREGQVNKNIKTSGKDLQKAANRSSTRMSKHETAVSQWGGEGVKEAKKSIAGNIKYHKSEVKRKKVLKEGLKKFGPKPPTSQQTAKSKGTLKKRSWLGLPDMGVTEFLGRAKKGWI